MAQAHNPRIFFVRSRAMGASIARGRLELSDFNAVLVPHVVVLFNRIKLNEQNYNSSKCVLSLQTSII